jgi:hypothetical protein
MEHANDICSALRLAHPHNQPHPFIHTLAKQVVWLMFVKKP